MDESFSLVVSVETKPTDGNVLKPHQFSAWSDWEFVSAKEGYYINNEPYDEKNNKRGLKLEILSDIGNENRADVIYDNWVEFPSKEIEGKTYRYPRTMKVRVHAKSPAKAFGGKGSTKYRYTGFFVQKPL